MNIYTSVLLVVVLGLGILDCAPLYYGHTADEWNSLDPFERAKAKGEYHQVINSINEQKHQDILDGLKDKVIKRGLGGNPF